MADNSKFQQKIKELYPEEVFSEKEMATMEREVIDFFTLLQQNITNKNTKNRYRNDRSTIRCRSFLINKINFQNNKKIALIPKDARNNVDI